MSLFVCLYCKIEAKVNIYRYPIRAIFTGFIGFRPEIVQKCLRCYKGSIVIREESANILVAGHWVNGHIRIFKSAITNAQNDIDFLNNTVSSKKWKSK